MPMPRLIHPVDVTILRVDKSSTAYDRDAREPLRSVARVEVRTVAQVGYKSIRDPAYQPQGIAVDAKGHLLFRVVDLDEVDYEPSEGDKITQIGIRAVELYVTACSDLGHYGDQGGATLVRAYFSDRTPASGRPIQR